MKRPTKVYPAFHPHHKRKGNRGLAWLLGLRLQHAFQHFGNYLGSRIEDRGDRIFCIFDPDSQRFRLYLKLREAGSFSLQNPYQMCSTQELFSKALMFELP